MTKASRKIIIFKYRLATLLFDLCGCYFTQRFGILWPTYRLKQAPVSIHAFIFRFLLTYQKKPKPKHKKNKQNKQKKMNKPLRQLYPWVLNQKRLFCISDWKMLLLFDSWVSWAMRGKWGLSKSQGAGLAWKDKKCWGLLWAFVSSLEAHVPHPRRSQTQSISWFTCGSWGEAAAKARVVLTHLQILPWAKESTGRPSKTPLEGV